MELISYLSNSDVSIGLPDIIVISTILWLFKSIWNGYLNDKQESKNDIRLALEKYSKLLHSLILYKSGTVQLIQLFDSINQSIPYLPYDITKQLISISEPDTDQSYLEDIILSIKEEVKLLKCQQHSFPSNTRNNNTLKYIEWVFYKNNIDSLFKTIVTVFFIIIFSLILMLYSILLVQADTIAKIVLMLCGIGLVLLFLIAIRKFDTWNKKTLSKSSK